MLCQVCKRGLRGALFIVVARKQLKHHSAWRYEQGSVAIELLLGLYVLFSVWRASGFC